MSIIKLSEECFRSLTADSLAELYSNNTDVAVRKVRYILISLPAKLRLKYAAKTANAIEFVSGGEHVTELVAIVSLLAGTDGKLCVSRRCSFNCGADL